MVFDSAGMNFQSLDPVGRRKGAGDLFSTDTIWSKRISRHVGESIHAQSSMIRSSERGHCSATRDIIQYGTTSAHVSGRSTGPSALSVNSCHYPPQCALAIAGSPHGSAQVACHRLLPIESIALIRLPSETQAESAANRICT